MTTRSIPSSANYQLIDLKGPSDLCIQLYPDGRLFAIRSGSILLNQVLPTPCEHAMTRMYLRDRTDPANSVCLIGPPLTDGSSHRTPAHALCDAGARTAHWFVSHPPFEIDVTLELHNEHPAWTWRVTIRNRGNEPRTVDVLYGQDLGLAHEAGVRMNEAYCSQYIDHCIVQDPRFGPVILSRQNQAQDGRFPWIAQGCLDGTTAWCTDGYQFFGTNHRCTGRPAALDVEQLPSRALQYEFAYVGLQSHPLEIVPGGEAVVSFFAVYNPNHPTASNEEDLHHVRGCLQRWHTSPAERGTTTSPIVPTVFDCPWLHGDDLQEGDWSALFPGEHRHAECDQHGRLLSFFTADGRHIVSRRKEAVVDRPHAHILRTGDSLWLDGDALGTTVAMAGIFNAQVYLGNTNLARFLSVIRNPLNVMRASGQRIFAKAAGGWRQLGVPSAFEMGLRHARWLYRIGGDLLEVTCRAREDAPQIDLHLRILNGAPRTFMLTHQIAAGENEMAHPFELHISEDDGRIECRPAPGFLLEDRWPGVRFTIQADAASTASIGGDELVFEDGRSRNGPYAVVVTKDVSTFSLHIVGETTNPNHPACRPSARLPSSLPRIHHHTEAAAGRLTDVLPWFAHDAWIHFTAPHGLEQYGGAAWGTRDVCQGPVEWLLATRRFDVVRSILLHVFEQQYETGSWPQWFMFEPFRFIQSVHSHGDIIFWPLMALCQYIEASSDFPLLEEAVPYTDTTTFASTQHREPVALHVERILSQYEARCIPGTALVNYGDGDWDDTLQPADPSLKSRMVSAWTVALAYDAFRRYRAVCQRAGLQHTAARLDSMLERMRRDFNRLLVAEGVVAGFAVFEDGGRRLLLHPQDELSGVRYRLLPMTRGVLSELFTPEQARTHLDIIRQNLLFPDGVRLMSQPIPYRGGVETMFRRAETAANFGREIGLMYTHAHIRYAEALAKLGDAEELWRALRVVNPISLQDEVPHAALRQANVYFTSSDGAFDNRYEAEARFDRLRDGSVPVKAGWRLYSSGPGLFVNKVVTCLLGIRSSFGDIVIDPVLPHCLDGLTAELPWNEHDLQVCYRVRETGYAPSRITVNGEDLPVQRRDANPYRRGGVRVEAVQFESCLRKGVNRVEVFV